MFSTISYEMSLTDLGSPSRIRTMLKESLNQGL